MKFIEPAFKPTYNTRVGVGIVNVSIVVSIRKSMFVHRDKLIYSIVFQFVGSNWGTWNYVDETERDLTFDDLIDKVTLWYR